MFHFYQSWHIYTFEHAYNIRRILYTNIRRSIALDWKNYTSAGVYRETQKGGGANIEKKSFFCEILIKCPPMYSYVHAYERYSYSDE